MKIVNINIKKYKMLEDITINFVKNNTDSGNAITVIAGVNGSGKTTLLDMIYKAFNSTIENDSKGQFDISFELNLNKYTLNNIGKTISKIVGDNAKEDILDSLFLDSIMKKNYENNKPKIIYIEALFNFTYEKRYEYKKSYKFMNIINENDALAESELFIRDFVLKAKDESLSADPKERTKEAIDKFNKTFLDIDFITKLKDLDIENGFKPIFENINGEALSIQNLSGGEQQLYARVVSLAILKPFNSIILIDEPDLGLHPKWQKKIMEIYRQIGENNQFIISTHSPHILSNINYKDLIFLYKENNKIISKVPEEAPLNGDIHSILNEFMHADFTPKKLQDLHNEYRKYIETNDEDSEKAKKVKEEILYFESIDSKFFKSIDIYKKINKNIQ